MLRWSLPRRLLAACWVLLVALPAWAGEVTLDMLDVGQGDGLLIRGGGKAVLVDAGISEARVVEQLAALGVDHLDLVVATHPHADHIGGMEAVVRAIDISLYMDNGLPHTTKTYDSLMRAVEERAIAYRPARRGLRLNMGDEASLTVLFPTDTPLKETRSDLNSNSVVMLLEHQKIKMLLTGDSEEPTEQALLTAGLPDIDVLKVAHHGSGHSSTAAFLDALRPEIAIISCGEGNRYGHPYPEALERLASAGATIYRTDLSGHLRVVSDGETVEVLEGLLPEFKAKPPPDREPVAKDRDRGSMDGPHPEEMGVDLSGVQEPVSTFDDLGPRKGRGKGKKGGE